MRLGSRGPKESATIRLRVPDIRHPQRKVFVLLPRPPKSWTGTTSWCGLNEGYPANGKQQAATTSMAKSCYCCRCPSISADKLGGSARHAACTREALVICQLLRHSQLMRPVRLEPGDEAILGLRVESDGSP